MPSSRELLIKLIRFALSQGYAERDGKEPPEPISLSQEEISLLGELYSLGEMHDVLPLVAKALEYIELPPEAEEAKAAFDRQKYIAVFRSNLLICEQEQIRQALNGAGIDFVLLKGAVLRTLYPEPWQRTSSDIDVLVKPENHEAAAQTLERVLGYSYLCETPHDVSYTSASGVHVELHFILLEENIIPESADILGKAWEYAMKKSEDSSEFVFTDDFFCFYHIAHMVKHFINGGCGLKPFVDLWVLGRSCKTPPEKCRRFLEAGRLDAFTKEAHRLAAVWLGMAEHTPLTRKMENYIFEGGVYGHIDNKVVVQTAKHGKLPYLMSCIFAPTESLKKRYPKMGKYKILIPIMHIRRWFGLLSPKRRKNVKIQMHKVSHAMKSSSKDVRELLDELNI